MGVDGRGLGVGVKIIIGSGWAKGGFGPMVGLDKGFWEPIIPDRTEPYLKGWGKGRRKIE